MSKSFLRLTRDLCKIGLDSRAKEPNGEHCGMDEMTMIAPHQVELLSALPRQQMDIAPFRSRLEQERLTMLPMTTMQINLGKLCNQTCSHCHVDAGPTRKEVMTRETMELCVQALSLFPFKIVDITGGAPEMVPHFRWLVEEVARLNLAILVRCNLTIIEANERFADLPQFYAQHGVQVVSSLPSFSKKQTDNQRGDGVFDKSISALRKLNGVGYGRDEHLQLNLVYNPNGAFLPGDQEELESEFKRRLFDDFGIVFNHLYTITNMPISRFLEYLVSSGNLNGYMRKLNRQFNQKALAQVMCRSMISVSWDGHLYDCDFNQMLDLPVRPGMHIGQFNGQKLATREVVVGEHCYGCTAGRGSSCGGVLEGS